MVVALMDIAIASLDSVVDIVKSVSLCTICEFMYYHKITQVQSESNYNLDSLK